MLNESRLIIIMILVVDIDCKTTCTRSIFE